MPAARGGSYGHWIAAGDHAGEFVISWRYDVKSGRMRIIRTRSRDTDRKGAERFCKRWGLTFPAEPLPRATVHVLRGIRELLEHSHSTTTDVEALRTWLGDAWSRRR